jgi:hypothetical protein
MIKLEEKEFCIYQISQDHQHKDTYEMVVTQEYIYSYHVHLGEPCDINLSSWALNQPLYVSNWKHILSNEYGVTWSSSPYLTFPNEKKFETNIFISSSIKRFNHHINYKTLISKLDRIPFFVTSVKSEYEYFKNHSGIDIECIYFDNLYDLHKAIYNCKLFIGNLSSPLTIAEACFKTRICILEPEYNSLDNITMKGLDTVYKNCLYIYNSNDCEKIEDFYTKCFSSVDIES